MIDHRWFLDLSGVDDPLIIVVSHHDLAVMHLVNTGQWCNLAMMSNWSTQDHALTWW
jgi:hypothetical protein